MCRVIPLREWNRHARRVLTYTDMQKRVVIIHGWGGYPDEGWRPWLKHELETKGFLVLVPAMPDTLLQTCATSAEMTASQKCRLFLMLS